MTKLMLVNKELIELYRSFKTTNDFLTVDYSYRLSYSELESLKLLSKKNQKEFHIKDVIPISSKIIPCFSISVILNLKNQLSAKDKMGIFKILFSDESFLLVAFWFSGTKKYGGVESLLVGEKETWIKFLKMNNKRIKHQEKPKLGIYNLELDSYGNLVYDKKDKLFTSEVIHPNFNLVEKDIEFYFDNINLFTKFNQSGIRKGMIIGEPGTGKTITGIKMAQKYAATKSVIYSNNLSAVIKHLIICKKHKVSTLIIFEDAEYVLNSGGQLLLNFLDGISQPRMLEGAYILMTTNYPEVIENRILKRPGRIDKIIHMGSLIGEYAYKCFKLYATGIYSKEIIGKEDEIIAIVNNLTGAQIKELVNASVSYAISNQTEINIKNLKNTLELMTDTFKNLPEYHKESSKMINTKKQIGYESNW